MKRSLTAAALAASWWCASVDAAPISAKAIGRSASHSGRDKPSLQMIDIALDAKQVLRGRFVDSTGAPIDGAVVALRQGDRVIARSTTLRDGSFEIDRVASGSYRLSCGSASGQIRCWTSEAAPPNAVVDGVTFQDSVVRGQAVVIAPALLGSSAMTTAAASGVAIGGVATYAAVEGEPSSKTAAVTQGTSSTISSAEVPVHGRHVVGRDTEGNLIRIRGLAPWEQDLVHGVDRSLDDPRWPASP
jgi:hypothetical protein